MCLCEVAYLSAVLSLQTIKVEIMLRVFMVFLALARVDHKWLCTVRFLDLESRMVLILLHKITSERVGNNMRKMLQIVLLCKSEFSWVLSICSVAYAIIFLVINTHMTQIINHQLLYKKSMFPRVTSPVFFFFFQFFSCFF